MKKIEGHIVYNPNDMWCLYDSRQEVAVIHYYNGYSSNCPEDWKKKIKKRIKDGEIEAPLPMVDPRLVSWEKIGELVPGPLPGNLVDFSAMSEPDIEVWADVQRGEPLIVPLGNVLCVARDGLKSVLSGGTIIRDVVLYVAAGLSLTLGSPDDYYSVYCCTHEFKRYVMLLKSDGRVAIVARSKKCWDYRKKMAIVAHTGDIIMYVFIPKAE